MQISDDLRRAVIFIGIDGGSEGFKAFGTAFFVQVEGITFLVTNQHISHQFEDGPFSVRMNSGSSSSSIVPIDPLELKTRWHIHPDDKDVDIAVLPFSRDMESVGFDTRVINENIFVTLPQIADGLIGLGDACYAIGLFHLMSGTQRNLPVVHSGNIALMPSSERVPIRDWVDPNRRRATEAYLVEMSNLKGLSGSPVFVRPSFVHVLDHSGVSAPTRMGLAVVRLLGVWQASWDSRPETITAIDHGREVRVPVGMGSVAPVSKLREILDTPELQFFRKQEWARLSTAGRIAPLAFS